MKWQTPSGILRRGGLTRLFCVERWRRMQAGSELSSVYILRATSVFERGDEV